MSVDLPDGSEALQQLADTWRDEEVPSWQRMRHLVQSKQPQVPLWLQWAPLAASLLVLLLQLARVEIDTRDGVVIRFGGHADSDAGSSAAQTAVLDARLLQFAQDQERSNRMLLSAWQESSRREYRQELGTLLTNWQSLRYQDQQKFTTRLNELANEQIESTQYLNALLQSPPRALRNNL